MATYAIGDIQGCYDSLQVLLERIQFDPRHDRVWLAGDLVNRGPKSLEVLRWARDLGDRVTAVLGNHDIHLLMRAAGVAGKKKRETLKPIIKASDRDDLIDWLRHQPLIHVQDGFAMVHAGLHPHWAICDAVSLAEQATEILRAHDWRFRISALSSSSNTQWLPNLPKDQRIRATTCVLTKIRTCLSNGDLCHDFAGHPDDAPPGCTPWFAVPEARWRDHCVLFGHWAALGIHVEDRSIALDSGCVWGGKLTAVRLDDRALFQVSAIESEMEAKAAG